VIYVNNLQAKSQFKRRTAKLKNNARQDNDSELTQIGDSVLSQSELSSEPTQLGNSVLDQSESTSEPTEYVNHSCCWKRITI
jgi:hypothetical protein